MSKRHLTSRSKPINDRLSAKESLYTSIISYVALSNLPPLSKLAGFLVPAALFFDVGVIGIRHWIPDYRLILILANSPVIILATMAGVIETIHACRSRQTKNPSQPRRTKRTP